MFISINCAVQGRNEWIAFEYSIASGFFQKTGQAVSVFLIPYSKIGKPGWTKKVFSNEESLSTLFPVLVLNTSSLS